VGETTDNLPLAPQVFRGFPHTPILAFRAHPRGPHRGRYAAAVRPKTVPWRGAHVAEVRPGMWSAPRYTCSLDGRCHLRASAFQPGWRGSG
jgi:hypothetical protein